ncbi:MAG: ribonuclease P protein component [Pseudanabaena frigida]|uniref:Ribonuclease P protein component n=1 Tax=Pseudanabaena frigida TaxID=945775 RepID=A0A2W4XPF1_9CYAN|nr:MAG: ribonuclease P protein component [Pseudanabaena frigida]
MLPNQNRLRRREDFAKVYANGDRYRGNYLNLRVLFDNNPTLDTRIGIVVSKKASKLAVTRNRFKRQLRAIFRQLLSQLKQGMQIVVTINTVQHRPSYQEIWDDLHKLLAKAKVLNGN